jgi:hypothetical protein
VRRLGRAVSGLAALTAATALATAGCSSSQQPAVSMPFWTYTLSTDVVGGKIQPPEADRTATMPGPDYIARFVLTEYPGFEWRVGTPEDASLLQYVASEGTKAEEFAARRSGSTKIVFTLVAESSAAASPAPAGIACPAGIGAPPPSSDDGCVLGRVTLTVIVP